MRPLEWLACLAFLPIALLPVLPPERRRAWILGAAPLPAAACALQAAAEGWRAQMLPLYGLAALVLLGRLPALLGRSAPHRSAGWRASAATALLAPLGGLIAGWLLPVIELPAPSGPYPVGIVDRELRDPARDRRLMVSVWYPAAANGPPAPLTSHPAQIADGLGAALGVPALAFQHLGYVSLAASAGPPAAAGAPFPILVFSHGMTGLRLQNSSMLQELASQGYVVVAIDHTDAAAVTVFSDGEAAFFDLGRFGVAGDPASASYAQAVDELVFPAWVADQRFVYDTLAHWAAGDPLLAGKLDLGRIGSLGHSFGGATALEVCRVDPRCRAAANLDGGLYGAMLSQPATRPLLLMTAEDSAGNAEAMAKWEAMISRAQAPAYWQELPGSNHLSFTISQLLSPLLVPGDFDPRAALRTIDRQLRGFFDQHLRGTPGRIFAPQPDTGDVRWRSP